MLNHFGNSQCISYVWKVRKCWGCILPGAGVGVFSRKCMSLQSQLVNNWDTNSFRLPPHLQICRTRLLYAQWTYMDNAQPYYYEIWNMKFHNFQVVQIDFTLCLKLQWQHQDNFFSKCSLWRQKLHTHSAHVDTVDQVNGSRMIMEHAFGQWTENYYRTTSCALLDSKFF